MYLYIFSILIEARQPAYNILLYAKGEPSRARPDQSSVMPYQMMLDCLPLYTLNICTYR